MVVRRFKYATDLISLITWKTICALFWCIRPCSVQWTMCWFESFLFSSLPYSSSPTIWLEDQRVGLGVGTLDHLLCPWYPGDWQSSEDHLTSAILGHQPISKGCIWVETYLGWRSEVFLPHRDFCSFIFP
jgi:hypothetical protein